MVKKWIYGVALGVWALCGAQAFAVVDVFDVYEESIVVNPNPVAKNNTFATVNNPQAQPPKYTRVRIRIELDGSGINKDNAVTLQSSATILPDQVFTILNRDNDSLTHEVGQGATLTRNYYLYPTATCDTDNAPVGEHPVAIRGVIEQTAPEPEPPEQRQKDVGETNIQVKVEMTGP